jgi:hypothetical protein
VELAKKDILPGSVEWLYRQQRPTNPGLTYLLWVLVVGVNQAGHGSSILGFSHQDLALPILLFAFGLGSVCSTFLQFWTRFSDTAKLTGGTLRTVLLANWVAWYHY